MAKSQIGEDELEEASGDEREHSGPSSHVELVEHGQDASDQEDRVADHPGMDKLFGTILVVSRADERMSPAAPEPA